VDVDLERLVDDGWARLHDLDYIGALAAFQTLQRREPESPRAYLYQAVTTWLQELERQQDLEVSSFIDSTHFGERERAQEDPLARERFEALVERAGERARERLRQDPDDVESRYLLGGVQGVRASYEATVGHNASAALKAAREAWRIQKAVVAKDPLYYDAYLTLGSTTTSPAACRSTSSGSPTSPATAATRRSASTASSSRRRTASARRATPRWSSP
jgi:hypothetical protein